MKLDKFGVVQLLLEKERSGKSDGGNVARCIQSCQVSVAFNLGRCLVSEDELQGLW